MKKSQLRNIIRKAIREQLNERDPNITNQWGGPATSGPEDAPSDASISQHMSNLKKIVNEPGGGTGQTSWRCFWSCVFKPPGAPFARCYKACTAYDNFKTTDPTGGDCGPGEIMGARGCVCINPKLCGKDERATGGEECPCKDGTYTWECCSTGINELTSRSQPPTSNLCDNPLWVNMPMGTSSNGQKKNYCERCAAASTGVVHINLHNNGTWSPTGPGSGIDYCPCCKSLATGGCDVMLPTNDPQCRECLADPANNSTPQTGLNCICCEPTTTSGNNGDSPWDDFPAGIDEQKYGRLDEEKINWKCFWKCFWGMHDELFDRQMGGGGCYENCKSHAENPRNWNQ